MRHCSEMPYHAGIVVRIYPSRRQKHVIAVNDGCGRSVYNRLVALNNERRQLLRTAALVPAYRDRLAYLDSILRSPQTALPAALKNMMPYLYGPDVDSLTVDNAIRHYNNAWKKFKADARAGVPAFHKKTYAQSYQTNAHYRKDAACINDGNVRFEDISHIVLPVLGRIRIKGSKTMLSAIMNRRDTRIGTITVSCDGTGRYFASLQLAGEAPFAERYRLTGSMAGIDLNIDNFLWDSNGRVVENPKFGRNERERMARLQKSLSRKAVQAKKDRRGLGGCKNYQKQRLELAKLHLKISGRSEDFRHVLSKEYVENQDYIFAEDLKVRDLLKDHRLAYAISECGWADFLNKLEYKARDHGKVFLKVPPQQTTQTCSCCGHVLTGCEKLTLGDREWVCPKCKTYHVRDYNAARNILAKGLAILSDMS